MFVENIISVKTLRQRIVQVIRGILIESSLPIVLVLVSLIIIMIISFLF